MYSFTRVNMHMLDLIVMLSLNPFQEFQIILPILYITHGLCNVQIVSVKKQSLMEHHFLDKIIVAVIK